MDKPYDAALSKREFDRFRDLIYANSHIHLSDRKFTLVRTRLAKVIRRLGLSSFRDYYDYVVADESGDAVRELINAISTNLTQFFRENQHFEYLAKRYMPRRIAAKRQGRDRRLRAWSAGCSTGEEPYTLSIVLAECLGELTGWDLKILATDIDSEVLEHARRGIYPKKSVEKVPGMLQQKYLIRGGTRTVPEFTVSDRLKRLIAFRQLNLMREAYPFRGPFDIIFCRNVMIYFDRPTQSRLVNRFYDLLAPGGVLFVGHSESLTGITHSFRYVQPTVYEK